MHQRRSPASLFDFDVDGSHFHIHRELVLFHAPFFCEFFHGQPAWPGETRHVTVHGIEPVVFAAFSHWLYNQILISPYGPPTVPNLDLLEGIWILGRRWRIPQLQNDAMERIPAAFKAATLNPYEQVDLERFFSDECLEAPNSVLNIAALDLAICYVGNATPENRQWFLDLLAPRVYRLVTGEVLARAFDNTLVNRFSEADIQTFFVPLGAEPNGSFIEGDL